MWLLLMEEKEECSAVPPSKQVKGSQAWGRNADLFGLHPVTLGRVQLLAGVGEGAVEAGAGKPAPGAFGVAAQVAHECLLPVQHVDGPHST